ncbi:MAG: ATP synthase F1 subunit gamma [Verrucomicrobia bacterium]|nr:ATP synthase F1 subunit gamma [Verrucomicrobiota bacterium]
MASTREIRRRIKSVRNTAQITKAMQMVASSKMVRAQQSALNGRPFATMAIDLMSRLAADSHEEIHPLMAEREIKKRALIVVSTDKGLCGALNSNLFREVAKYDPAATVFIAVGRKAAQFLARARRKLAAEFSYHDTPDYADCRAISRFAQELFLKGEVDVVEVMFTRFINTLSQRPEALVLLPSGSIESKRARLKPEVKAAAKPTDEHREYLFEPNAAELLDRLLQYLLDFEVGQLLLEAKASEHSARMVAMKSATDNAQQLIKDLTLEYNKMRQASITTELLEISSAAMALG